MTNTSTHPDKCIGNVTEPSNPTCDNTTHKFSHCDCKEPVSLDHAPKISHEGNDDAKVKQPEWRQLGEYEAIEADDEYKPSSIGEWIPVPYGWIGSMCDLSQIRTRRPLPKQEEIPLEDFQAFIDGAEEQAKLVMEGSSSLAFACLIDAIRYLREEIQKLKAAL